jgi:hypothetical protein
MNDINITNLLECFYKFGVKSSFHMFVQKQYLKNSNGQGIFFQ